MNFEWNGLQWAVTTMDQDYYVEDGRKTLPVFTCFLCQRTGPGSKWTIFAEAPGAKVQLTACLSCVATNFIPTYALEGKKALQS